MNPNSNKVLTFNDIINDGHGIYVSDCVSKINYEHNYGLPITNFWNQTGVECPSWSSTSEWQANLTKCVKYNGISLENTVDIGFDEDGATVGFDGTGIIYGDYQSIIDSNQVSYGKIMPYDVKYPNEVADDKLVKSSNLTSLTEYIAIFDYYEMSGLNVNLKTNLTNTAISASIGMWMDNLAGGSDYYWGENVTTNSSGSINTTFPSYASVQTVAFKKDYYGDVAHTNITLFVTTSINEEGCDLESAVASIKFNGKTYNSTYYDIYPDGAGYNELYCNFDNVAIEDIPYFQSVDLTLNYSTGGGTVEPEPDPDPQPVVSYIDLSNWHIKTSNTRGNAITVSLNRGLDFLRSGCWFTAYGATGVAYMFDSNGYNVDPEEYSFTVDINPAAFTGMYINVDTNNNPPVGNYLIGIPFDDNENNNTGSPRIQSEIYFYLNFDEFGNVTDLADGESWINLVNSHYDAIEAEANGEYDVTFYAYNRAARIKHFDNSLPLTGNIQQIAKGTTYNYTTDYSGNAPSGILLNKNGIAASGGSGILTGACKKPGSGFTSWKTLTAITSLTTAFKNVYILPNAYCNTFENIIRFIKYGPTFRV